MMKDAAHRLRKEKKRPRKVERVVAAAAFPAESFDHRCGHAALRAEGSRDTFKPGPALRTGRRPPALEDLGTTKDTRLRIKQIQDRVDHGNLSVDAKGEVTLLRVRVIVQDADGAIQLFDQEQPRHFVR